MLGAQPSVKIGWNGLDSRWVDCVCGHYHLVVFPAPSKSYLDGLYPVQSQRLPKVKFLAGAAILEEIDGICIEMRNADQRWIHWRL